MDKVDFNVRFFKFDVGGFELVFTQTMLNTLIVMGVLILFAIIVRIKIKNFKPVPESKFQNFVEIIVGNMNGFTIQNMGKKYAYFGGWFFTIFAFVMISNFMGLLTFRPPTADLATTMGLALTTFFLIHFMGLYVNKGGYFKGYIDPLPGLLPLNIIGEIATPLSLGLRLFGNILGGTIIMGLFYTAIQLGSNMLTKILLPLIGVPVASILHIYFDLFAGFLQSFIFVILSMSFIKEKIGD